MFATNELLWFIWVFPSVYLPLSGISSNGSLCASIGNTVRGYSRYHRHQLFWCTTMKLYGQHEWFVSDNDTTMRFEYWAASSEEGRWGQSLLKIEWRQLAASNKAAMKTGTCFINNCLQCHYDKKNINETSIGMRITFLTFQLPGYRYSGCWCSQHHRQQDAHTHTHTHTKLGQTVYTKSITVIFYWTCVGGVDVHVPKLFQTLAQKNFCILTFNNLASIGQTPYAEAINCQRAGLLELNWIFIFSKKVYCTLDRKCIRQSGVSLTTTTFRG